MLAWRELKITMHKMRMHGAPVPRYRKVQCEATHTAERNERLRADRRTHSLTAFDDLHIYCLRSDTDAVRAKPVNYNS